jgi:hypothetical protein
MISMQDRLNAPLFANFVAIEPEHHKATLDDMFLAW